MKLWIYIFLLELRLCYFQMDGIWLRTYWFDEKRFVLLHTIAVEPEDARLILNLLFQTKINVR